MRIAALWFIIVLAGCAAQAAGTGAWVNVDALVRVHPLYGTLAQYDRQIAALRSSLNVPEFSRKQQAIAHAARAVDAELNETAGSARAIAAQPSPDVRALEQRSVGNAPTESRVRSDVQRTYSAQAAQLQQGARAGMAHYRAALEAEQSAALANYERGVRARVQQAYNARAQELYEKESTLALDLAKRDSGKRLAIRTKLQTLQLGGDARRALQAQMDAIQAHEDAVVAQQQRRDRSVLAAYLAQLQARAAADIARTSADLQRRTAANLAARQRVLIAQQAHAQQLQFGPAAQPAATGTDMRGRLDALLRAQPADPQAFLAARSDLAKQFAGIRGADNTATRNVRAEIAALQRDRAQLYHDMVSQILNDARAVAGARGLQGVYTGATAPPGATDITAAVRSDFLALR
jgi:hypothetical protein